MTGVVAELGVREGVAVNPGMTLFRIAGLEKVWAVAEIPEVQAIRLKRGQKVKAALQADASQTFDGELKEILPQVSANTRTVQARFEVANKAGAARARACCCGCRWPGRAPRGLVLPAEAVIRTGTRAVAIVRRTRRLLRAAGGAAWRRLGGHQSKSSAGWPKATRSSPAGSSWWTRRPG